MAFPNRHSDVERASVVLWKLLGSTQVALTSLLKYSVLSQHYTFRITVSRGKGEFVRAKRGKETPLREELGRVQLKALGLGQHPRGTSEPSTCF